MAVTKIWPVRDNLCGLVSYAENPEKTLNPDAALCGAIEYAADEQKTMTEKSYFVTGINCFAENAAEQMALTKRRFDKEGGVVAHHAYQSFKPGEVTPELCHEIGVKLAQKLWGDSFEVVVATHLNTNCCHNHFVINSVSFKDGRKIDWSFRSYYDMRAASDELCREYGLSVQEQTANSHVTRKIYQDEKAGKPTLYNIIREDIDAACLMATSPYSLQIVLERMGYTLGSTKTGKPTIKAQGMKYPVTFERLGADYKWQSLRHRTLKNYDPAFPRLYPIKITRARFRGSFKTMKKITGIKALYYHFLYRMGIIPKGGQRKPISAEMRHEVMKLDSYSDQLRLLTTHNINTVEELQAFRQDCQSRMDTLVKARSHVDNRRKRCNDPIKREEYSQQRKELTAVISGLRKDIKTAAAIEEGMDRMKQLIGIEKEQRDIAAGRKKPERRNAHDKQKTDQRRNNHSWR